MGQLGIHVINGGIGESIVIHMPNDEWGVVDCYASSLADSGSNHTLNFLRGHNVSKLAFLCLTHPHDDHYRGLHHILDNVQVDHFWRFGAFTPRDLKRILLRYFKATATKSQVPEDLENADHLTEILSKVRKMKADRKIKRIIKLSDVKPLYPWPFDATSDLQIISIAPSTDNIDLYEEVLARCFDQNGKLVGSLPRQQHNQVSVALILKFGETRVVLGGDVEAHGWKETLASLPSNELRAHAVKVSHHGSDSGYTGSLWGHFSAEVKPCAVITPFRRFGLPKRPALIHIQAHCKQVLTTSRSATLESAELPSSFWRTTSLQSHMLLAHTYRNWRPADLPVEHGACSLFLDDKGHCEWSCHGDASPIGACSL